MARGVGSGWGTPPRWAWVTIALAAMIFVAMALYAVNRPLKDPVSRAQLDRMTAAAAAYAKAHPDPTRILIVGDSYTGGSDMGGNGVANWVHLAGADLVTAGYNVEITPSASGGSGYAQGGQRNLTFEQLAGHAGGNFNLVVFFGSRNDSTPVLDAGRSAFAAAKIHSPQAGLLVIGPPWVNGTPPRTIVADRDQLAQAAAEVGATFVDPLKEGWFTGPNEALIGSDNVHPTDEGHRHMAELIVPRLEQSLQALGATPHPAA